MRDVTRNRESESGFENSYAKSYSSLQKDWKNVLCTINFIIEFNTVRVANLESNP